METVTSILNIAKVAFGLGFVIFLHELGHFLLAKWNGVKVEKFSIGFGHTLIGFHRGETEYVLAVIPLGGFVKMLGEGTEDESSKSTDPRAYPNKSVGARMAIISAGVIMNVLLGLSCFVYAYGQGMDEMPAIIGGVEPGSPAYRAGIRAGDEIVAVDGDREISYETVTQKVRLSSTGQKLHFDIKRPGEKELVKVDIEPKREPPSPFPRIGIAATKSLLLADPPLLATEGLGLSKELIAALGLKVDDQVVAIAAEGTTPRPIQDALELEQHLAKARTRPVTLVFSRQTKGTEKKTFEVTLPPRHVIDFGFRLTLEPISAIRPGSPADKAGLRVGDRIVEVGGKADLDPMRLPDFCYEHAGQPLTVTVARMAADKSSTTTSVEITPDSSPPAFEILGASTPLEIPGLGLACPVRTRIVAIRDGSPAARAGLKPGDEITKLTLLPQTEKNNKKAKPTEIAFSDKAPLWPLAFVVLQREPFGGVDLTIKGRTAPLTIRPEVVPDWFATDRGLQFQPLFRRLPPQSVGAALRRGAEDTLENILIVYASLRSLVQQRLSPENFGGPLLIAQIAYSQAKTGLTEFIHFLGIMSINLAVLNFLPIPPLDGGQMAFLVAEKVRGRPLPDSAMIVVSWTGIALLLCLMLFVVIQDVVRTFFW